MTDDAARMPLARLFAMAYRDLIDELHERLVQRGWTDVRPAFGFVLLAARDAPTTPTDVAALMGTTKQAASKITTAMVSAGYLVDVDSGSADGRARPLRLSRSGAKLLATVEQIYTELETEWADVIGVRSLERLRRDVIRAISATHGGELPAIRPVW